MTEYTDPTTVKPGSAGTATVRGEANVRVMRLEGNWVFEWVSASFAAHHGCKKAGLFWQSTAGGVWMADDGTTAYWDQLVDVTVLRVGIGSEGVS